MKENKQKAYRLGKKGEEAALAYLKAKKYRIIKKGFRLYRGEIDIIAFDRKTLVFVEVKTRHSRSMTSPEESVSLAKQQLIKKIAQGFMALNDFRDVECRFDVLSMTFDEKSGYSISQIQDAF